MRPMFYIISVVLLFVCLAQAEDTIEKVYDAKGNLKETYEKLEPRDGKFRGIMRQYYTNGNLRTEMFIIGAPGELGFAPDGDVKCFHENGLLASSVHWDNTKKNGPFQYFYSSGKLRESGTYTNDTSVTSTRRNRKGDKLQKSPHLHIELDLAQGRDINQVTLHMDNFHDKWIHLGWVFGCKLVDERWKRVFKRARGNDLEPRESKIAILDKSDFSEGKWKIVVSYDVVGKPLKYIESESQTFEIKQ